MRRSVISAALAGLLALAAVGAPAQTNGERCAHTRCAVDYANATYRIEDEDVRLVDGERAVPVAPGSAAQRVTRVIGKPVFGQVGAKPAAAVVLRDEPGGSGAFYYVAVVFGGAPNAVFKTVLLGDRISPQTIAFRRDAIVVAYWDRKPDERMATQPTVRKTVKLRLDMANGALIAIEPTTPNGVTRGSGKSGD
jgi:hypothetical protein